MIREITLGQYYPSDSVIHKLDPRTKIVGTFIFIIALFIFNNVAGFVLATLFLGAIITVSKVPFSFIIKGMKSVAILMTITVLFNLFLTPGEVICTFGPFVISHQGVRAALLMIVRLSYLILGSSMMTLTTTPNNLTDGLEKLLKPLEIIKMPVHEISMMMSIALRFIPILIEETDKIMKAQMARCADFESGGLIKKAKSMVPLLVPLFVSAFRRANDLAMAMEARCYKGGDGRTKMKPLKYVRIDYVAYLVTYGFLIGMILCSVFSPI